MGDEVGKMTMEDAARRELVAVLGLPPLVAASMSLYDLAAAVSEQDNSLQGRYAVERHAVLQSVVSLLVTGDAGAQNAPEELGAVPVILAELAGDWAAVRQIMWAARDTLSPGGGAVRQLTFLGDARALLNDCTATRAYAEEQRRAVLQLRAAVKDHESAAAKQRSEASATQSLVTALFDALHYTRGVVRGMAAAADLDCPPLPGPSVRCPLGWEPVDGQKEIGRAHV